MTAPTSRPTLSDVVAIRAHPSFGAAMRADAGSIVGLYRGNRLLNALMNDRALALFTLAALYLHYAGSAEGRAGLTISSMKALCARIDLCSGGRCEATLALMRFAGFFAVAPGVDRRSRPLVPTEKLYALQRARLRVHLSAMTSIMPEAADYVAALDDPAFVRRLVMSLSRDFIDGTRMIQHVPEMETIVDRKAGLLILLSLALAGPEGSSFPPAEPVPLSISALAKAYSVSRKHVLTLLRDAEAQGLLARGVDTTDRVVFLPRGRAALETFFATIFAFFARCGQQSLAESNATSDHRALSA